MTFNRGDLYRELENAAHPDPVARLKAIHAVGAILRSELDAALDAAELVNVRRARSTHKPRTWGEIGRALGVTHTQAMRRFKDRL